MPDPKPLQFLDQALGALRNLGLLPAEPESAPIVRILDRIAHLEPDKTFVALADGRIVGVASYILLDDAWAETASLAVEPAWRGKGVGDAQDAPASKRDKPSKEPDAKASAPATAARPRNAH